MRHTALLAFLLPLMAVADQTNAYIIVTNAACGNANGTVRAQLTGGNIYNPLTYLWNTGATTEEIAGVPAGSYWVEITDAQDSVFTALADVLDMPSLPYSEQGSPTLSSMLTGFIGEPCPGQCNGVFGMPGPNPPTGLAPYTYEFSIPTSYLGSVMWDSPVYAGFCEGEVATFTYMDATGCAGTGSTPIGPGIPAPGSVISTTEYCANGSGGSVSFFTSWWGNDSLEILMNGAPFMITTIGDANTVITDLEPGSYHVYDWPMIGPYTHQCGPGEYDFEIYDMGPTCGQVIGEAWYDLDADCVFDGNEVGMAGNVLQVAPGGQLILVGQGGHFEMNLDAGNYMLTQLDAYVDPICPAVQPVPFTVNGGWTTIDLANWSTEPMDISLYMHDGVARPGFDQHVHGHVTNPTPQATGPVTITCNFDPLTVYVSSVPAPTSEVGNTVIWDLPSISYFGSVGFHSTVNIPISVPLGTALTHSCVASNTLPEITLANNAASTTTIVTGSYDPNDKTARTSTGWSDTQFFIDQDEWINYTIRFQNTGTDTAFTVVITDTLSEELDMTTFEQGASSHPFLVNFKPGRVVEWRFENILLPDSNVNEAASHGLVGFRIRPHAPLLPGTLIENTANIFFDFNAPVITEPSVLVAEMSTGVQAQEQGKLQLFPDPASTWITISAPMAMRSVRILAMDGRTMMVQPLTGQQEQLSIEALPAGSYCADVRLADGSSLRRSFIVH